jgi:hypothetical protein
MTAVEVLGSVDELADGTAGSVDAATGAAIGPYRRSRVDVVHAPEVEDHHERALAEDGLDAVRQVLRGAEEEGAIELEYDDAPLGDMRMSQ